MNDMKQQKDNQGMQGEPVAWAWEYRWPGSYAAPTRNLSFFNPGTKPFIHNIRPLYEAPAAPRSDTPPKPAVTVGFGDTPPDLPTQIAAAVMGLDWVIPKPTGDAEADAEEMDRRFGTLQETVLAVLTQDP